MIVFLETGMGATLVEAPNVARATRATLERVGTINGVSLAREATPEDILYVYQMGGAVPKSALLIIGRAK